MSDSPPLLQLKEVSVFQGGENVLNDINLSFTEGECVVITGPSGSGKTFLLKVSAGLVLPEKGELFIRGRSYGNLNKRELTNLRGNSGFVFQDSALWANQSILQNLSLPLRLHFPRMTPLEQKELVNRLLNRFQIKENLNNRPHQLSTGEQKLLSLCRALITDPQLIFMDEPTTFIDYTIIDTVIQEMKDLKKKGKTLIVVTQDIAVVQAIADRVIILQEGALSDQGSLTEIRKSTKEGTQKIVQRILGKKG